jgi:hypothetical protein
LILALCRGRCVYLSPFVTAAMLEVVASVCCGVRSRPYKRVAPVSKLQVRASALALFPARLSNWSCSGILPSQARALVVDLGPVVHRFSSLALVRCCSVHRGHRCDEGGHSCACIQSVWSGGTGSSLLFCAPVLSRSLDLCLAARADFDLPCPWQPQPQFFLR